MTTHVSDHAILRWLEKSCGLNVDRLREGLKSHAADVAAEIHCPTIILPDGCRLQLSRNVITDCQRPMNRPLRRRCNCRSTDVFPLVEQPATIDWAAHADGSHD